jgi:hypothetical protein
VPQPHEAERFSQAGDSAVLLYNRAEAVFFESRNDNDWRSVFARIQGFQDRHPVHARIHIEDDGHYIFETFMTEVKKSFAVRTKRTSQATPAAAFATARAVSASASKTKTILLFINSSFSASP